MKAKTANRGAMHRPQPVVPHVPGPDPAQAVHDNALAGLSQAQMDSLFRGLLQLQPAASSSPGPFSSLPNDFK